MIIALAGVRVEIKNASGPFSVSEKFPAPIGTIETITMGPRARLMSGRTKGFQLSRKGRVKNLEIYCRSKNTFLIDVFSKYYLFIPAFRFN